MLNWFKRRNKKAGTYQTNEDWVQGLSHPAEEQAVKELRQRLIKGLKPALYKYVDFELDQFVEDVAQDALLKILDNIETFRGESKFTTWAMKIAVREGLSELRRKKYDDYSLEDFKGEEGEGRSELSSLTFATDLPSPEDSTNQRMALSMVMEVINNELTDKQKQAIHAILVQEMSPTAVAEKMGTNRNALYKLIYDARMKIKNKLEVEGIDTTKLLNNL